MCCRTAMRSEKIDSGLKRRPDAACRRNDRTWSVAYPQVNAARIADEREFDTFSYDAETDATKIIQVERCTALAEHLGSSARRRRENNFFGFRTAIDLKCMD